MKTKTIINQLKKSSQKLLLIFSCLLAFILGWSGSGINPVNAATVGNNLPLIAEFDNSGIGNQLEGARKEIEGKAQRMYGNTESNFENAAKKANRNTEETTNELKESTKENLRKAQGSLDKTGDKVQDNAEGVIDTIKDFFQK